MAGYDCEFVNTVGEEYKCKKCSKVARGATLSSCCGENFCEACITDIIHKEKPCPQCGKREIQFLKQVKYQQHISGLQVFCSMKERGCDWTGRLDQLATHLDPDLNNCQFVDEKCPLHCGTVVPRNMLEEHVASECVKREHFCRYCNYKASYEEIEGQHMPVCEYVPLQCPNRCGVTSEREHMEDHLKMCPLQEIPCDFNSVGCEDWFTREDQEEHNRENIQNHLSMVSRAQQKYQEKMEEDLGKKLVNITSVVEKKLVPCEEKLTAQEEKLGAQEEKLGAQEEALNKKFTKLESMMKQREESMKRNQKDENAVLLKILGVLIFLISVILAVVMFQVFSHHHPSLETKLETMKQQWQELNASLENKTTSLETKIEQTTGKQLEFQKLNGNLTNLIKLNTSTQQRIYDMEYNLQEIYNRTKNISMLFKNGFKMAGFSAKQSAGGSWTSPAMYTHVGGYKFVFHVHADGTLQHPHGVYVKFQIVAGEFDNDLQWPARIHFSAQLVDVHGNTSIIANRFVIWETPGIGFKKFLNIESCNSDYAVYFLCHSEVKHFLSFDALKFKVSSIVF